MEAVSTLCRKTAMSYVIYIIVSHELPFLCVTVFFKNYPLYSFLVKVCIYNLAIYNFYRYFNCKCRLKFKLKSGFHSNVFLLFHFESGFFLCLTGMRIFENKYCSLVSEGHLKAHLEYLKMLLLTAIRRSNENFIKTVLDFLLG